MKLYVLLAKIAFAFFKPLALLIDSKELEKKLFDADVEISLPEYLSLGFMASIVSAFFVVLVSLVLFAFINFEVDLLLFVGLFFIFLISFIGLVFVYPYYLVFKKAQVIRNNLALAILSMSTIVESGTPPSAMFQNLGEAEEYPVISRELSKVQRFMDELGLSLSAAITHLAKLTVSNDLRKFLIELKASMSSGGDLGLFMQKRADKAQFEYVLRMNEVNQRAETFGDIYTGVVIAAPLFIFSAIMLMGMFGGTIFGLTIDFLLTIGIFLLIPALNIVFLLLMEIMSPGGM
ncbi:MAG: type II secretion system F family protein [archaeon]